MISCGVDLYDSKVYRNVVTNDHFIYMQIDHCEDKGQVLHYFFDCGFEQEGIHKQKRYTLWSSIESPPPHN